MLELVKGPVAGSIVVNQLSGFDDAAGCLSVALGGPLLVAGETAFFSVSFDLRTGFYDINGASHGAVRAPTQFHQNHVIARFTEACVIEIELVDATQGKGCKSYRPRCRSSGHDIWLHLAERDRRRCGVRMDQPSHAA